MYCFGLCEVRYPRLVKAAFARRTGEALRPSLVVNIIELSYETWYTIVNDHSGGRMMLYRSRIDDDLDEISHTCHLGLGAAAVRLAYEPGDMGAVGRDQGRFQ